MENDASAGDGTSVAAILQPTKQTNQRIVFKRILNFSALEFSRTLPYTFSHGLIYAIDGLDKSNELEQYLAGAYGR